MTKSTKKEIIEYVILGAIVLISYGCGIASVETAARSAAERNKTLPLVFYSEELNITIKND